LTQGKSTRWLDKQLYWLLANKNAGDTITTEFEDSENGTQTVSIKLEPRK
jgi:hypothetical protein